MTARYVLGGHSVRGRVHAFVVVFTVHTTYPVFVSTSVCGLSQGLDCNLAVAVAMPRALEQTTCGLCRHILELEAQR